MLRLRQKEDGMERRTLGTTGESLSVIGFGAIVFVNEGPEFGRDTVARAIDAGVNYFDMGPAYGGGEAEERGGPAIEPYRSRIFLAEKTGKRTKDEAAAQLRESLVRMRTDHFDLYQLHGVSTMEDVETIVGPGGALEAFVEARDQGLVRFLGFSAHTEEAALALMDHYDFDTVLFPVNYVTWYQGHFGPAVLAKARDKEMGILALKALAKKPWPNGRKEKWPKAWYAPVDTYEEARTALRWTLSRPVTACVSPSHAELLWWMIDAEKDLTPLSPEEEQAVARSTENVGPIFAKA
jgi:aryl-alcohol dehydrogenase-like predicted oxidoreductase